MDRHTSTTVSIADSNQSMPIVNSIVTASFTNLVDVSAMRTPMCLGKDDHHGRKIGIDEQTMSDIADLINNVRHSTDMDATETST